MAQRQIEWTGGAELNRKFNELSKIVGNKKADSALRSASRSAMRPMQKAAKANVSVGKSAPHIRDNIIIRKSRKSREDKTITQVAIRAQDKKYRANKSNRRKGRVGKTWKDLGYLFYAPFQEFGVPSRNIPAQAFMRRAFEAHREEVPRLFAKAFEKSIDRALRKFRK